MQEPEREIEVRHVGGVLQGGGDIARLGQREVPDRQPRELRLERHALQQPLRLPVEIDEVRADVGGLDAAGIVVPLVDAAVGDHQGLAVRQQREVMRADAEGREFAEPRIAGARVVDADHALVLRLVILGRQQQVAALHEQAVAGEMARRRGRDLRHHLACQRIEHQREPAGPAREADRLAAAWPHGKAVAAVGKVEIEVDLAVLVDGNDGVSVVGKRRRGGEVASAVAGARRLANQQSGRTARQQARAGSASC